MTAAGALRLGIDIGGTFTDLVALRGDRLVAVAKVLTTPEDPSLAVADGVRVLLEGLEAAAVSEVVHGTTLVPNALIERRGAKTALVTTRGFRDTLAIRREQRYDLYDLFLEFPEPLVPRRRRWEVSERMLADGSVDTAIDLDEVRTLARRALEEGIEAIAISFLHSFRNPTHERSAAAVVREVHPSVSLSISSEVAPEIGEYVRTSTTVANAYVQPLVDGYLEQIRIRLAEIGIGAPIHIMLSTGGLTDLTTARAHPIRLTESGPAAGVIGAAYVGRRSGYPSILAFDMGGTTAKACLVEDGTPLIAREHEVARVHRFLKGSGLPVRIPVVDLIEIGAGGGSIARLGVFGLPKVGPESASSVPGPACYGLAGTRPTVTDADLLLGYLDAEFFLGGTMRLDRAAAEAAVGGLGAELGLDPITMAAGIHRVVNENMAAATRMHAIERGRDLRRFTLVATGGAGPIHAWGVARALGIERIVYPPAAGVASAIGMLVAPPAFDLARSDPGPLDGVDWSTLAPALDELRRKGCELLARVGVREEEMTVSLQSDIRYRGQGDPVTVDIGPTLPTDEPARSVRAAFERAYIRLYGRLAEGMEPEVLTWRIRVEAAWRSLEAGEPSGSGDFRKGRRQVWSEERRALLEAVVVDRYRLGPGDTVEGPAVVEERESSVVIGEGGRATVDEQMNLVVRIHG